MSIPAFILVRPQMGENIGAAARAMLNFGLDQMGLVAPRDGWPNPAAIAISSGAGRVLDGARLYPDIPAALAACDYVMATTARTRELSKPVFSPEHAMQTARALCGQGKKVAVLFGPERAGLENEDLVRANALISIPVNPEFASLNLAQSVLLMGYEWQRSAGHIAPEVMNFARTEFAGAPDIEALARHFEDRLERAGFFFPPDKAAGMKLSLRNMWSRLPLTAAEVRTFHGMLRQISYRLDDERF